MTSRHFITIIKFLLENQLYNLRATLKYMNTLFLFPRPHMASVVLTLKHIMKPRASTVIW